MSYLYELTGQYKMLENAMLLNPEDEELKAEFDKIQDDIKVKAENYACIIKNFEADAEALGNEIKRLTERKKQFENNAKRLKENLMWSMKETGETKFKTERFSFSVGKAGGLAPMTLKVDAKDLPKELQKVSIEADNTAIRKYIEETGDFTYAEIEERKDRLSIR